MRNSPRHAITGGAPITQRLLVVAVTATLAGCASAPRLTPWQATPLIESLPPTCATAEDAPALVPGGISVVRSEGADVILVAARGCVLAIDAASGQMEPLPTRGDSIAPTMLDGASGGIAFSSSLSGSVRLIDTEGAVRFNVSALHRPLGVRFMPGGSALVAEHDTGRLLRLGPSDESRARLVAEKLDGPVDIVVTDAMQGYVTEARAGRVTRFRIDRFETTTIAKGLHRPEGIAVLADGRLAVVEAGLRRLVAVDPLRGTIEVMADGLLLGEPAASGEFPGVADVAAAPDGTLYVTAPASRTVLRVTRRTPAAAR